MGKHKNIHHKLRDEKSQLPSEYSWDNMMAGIESKMDAKDLAPASQDSPKKSNKLGYSLLVFGFLSLIGGCFYLYQPKQVQKVTLHTQTSDVSSEAHNSTHSPETQVATAVKHQKNNGTVGKITTETVANIPQTNNPSQDKTKTFNQISKTAQPTSEAIKISATSKLNKSSQTQNTSTLVESSVENTTLNPIKPILQSSGTKAQKIIHQVSDESKAPKFLINHTSIASLYPRVQTNGPVVILNLQPEFIQNTSKPSIEQQEKLTPKIIASLGSNLYTHNYSNSELATLRNTANSRIIGQSAQLLIELPLRNQWSIVTGIGYDRSLTRLDYSGVIDTTLMAEVTIHDTNLASGLINTHQEPQTVDGTFHTQVELYNNYHSISVPLTLQKSIPLGHLLLNIGAGPEYRYSSHRNGRYLTDPITSGGDHQLANYGDYDPFKSHLLIARTSVSLDYQFGSGFGIGGGLDGTYSLTQASREANTQSNPMLLRGTVRLFKTL